MDKHIFNNGAVQSLSLAFEWHSANANGKRSPCFAITEKEIRRTSPHKDLIRSALAAMGPHENRLAPARRAFSRDRQ